MILDPTQQERLIYLVNNEILTNECTFVPKYQSHNNMHRVYENVEEFKILTNEVLLQSYALFENKYRVQMCWFNIIKQSSPYEINFHTHGKSDLTCVYYLKNCTGNGTVLLFDGKEKQLSCLDNTIQFISSTLMHSIPKFNGNDRYSIVFDLIKA